MTQAFIALGSNLGDRRFHLEGALRRLGNVPGIRVVRRSTYHETEPVGGPPGQGAYLNAAAELDTDLAAAELLGAMLRIETELGRVRTVRDGPRTIDLDLLLYGDVVQDDAELVLPHPRMHDRLFVLLPLLEIAPAVVHPVLGRTIAELAQQLTTAGQSWRLSGLRAMITGSTSGIGREMALAFAESGADVIVHGRRSPTAADEVAAKVTSRGVRAGRLMADLRDAQECRRVVNEAWTLWKGLDVWVNNAGADVLTGEAADWPFERKLQELVDVDLTATMLLSREIGQRMKEAGHGLIVNIGWDQAETGMEGDSGQLFGAVKGAVMAFTKSLAVSLAPEVRVNCIAPGWIRTGWAEGAAERWQQRGVRESLLESWGSPRDVAKVAVWLATSGAAFVTGQIVRVNGGAVR